LRSENSGADSDHWTFTNIAGAGNAFDVHLTYNRQSATEAEALNLLTSIDIIQYNAGADVVFKEYGRGLDIGKFHWDVVDDGAGIVSAVKTERTSTLLQNSVAHAYAVRNVVEKLSNSMHKRVGELQWIESSAPRGDDRFSNAAWARGIYKNSALGTAAGGSLDLYGAEFGYDFRLKSNAANRLFVGVMGYAAAAKTEYKTANPIADTGDIAAYGVGLYGIWLGRGGWFADAALRQHFISQKVDAYAAGSPSAVKFDTSNMATSLNIDLGRELAFAVDRKTAWIMTPHAQLSGASVSGSDFVMSNGQGGTAKSAFNAQAYVGAQTGPRFAMAGDAKLQLYAKAGYVADLSGDTKVDFGGLEVANKFDTGNYEFGGGMNFKSANGRTMLYLDGLYRMGDEYTEFGGVLGLRYGF